MVFTVLNMILRGEEETRHSRGKNAGCKSGRKENTQGERKEGESDLRSKRKDKKSETDSEASQESVR